MTNYYIDRYLKNRTFYKIQSQSIIDNPDQRIVDDLSSFTGTALSFSLTLFNAAVDLVSFSNILYVKLLGIKGGIYSKWWEMFHLEFQGLVTLNFLQEKKEADFRFGLVRLRENAESIAFYAGEDNEKQLLLQRFRSAFENLTDLITGRTIGSGKAEHGLYILDRADKVAHHSIQSPTIKDDLWLWH
ncbi:ABC transporter D family member 2, chloroplastic-like isoform X2 [Camellia sinensis]|uniref:ABC transporter D family member 2, chloroplastic-like isoform X2 n=1 Tax=Camellia sinensis TaxID=4442 RepID=UPI0010369D88|nr:ABC transporter D family member 2, chloroplastic-like isoform X2 [Camellia sinensis]